MKPSWEAVEAARVEVGLKVDPAVKLLGLSRTGYYRHVRGMTDYTPRRRPSVAMRHRDTLLEVALKRPEAGHRKVREYAVAWQQLARGEAGTSRMSCYRILKADGLIQPGRPGAHLKEIRDRRRQMLEVPTRFNQVLQCDFTDYETEDGETYRIGCVTEYLSRFNLVSIVLDTETSEDLIRVTDAALDEVARCGHDLPPRVVVVTDNGPAMKSRRYRNYIQKTERLVHIRGQKYHPQTIGREERYHGSLKLEWLYRYVPRDRSELVDRVAKYRSFYNHERIHESLEYRTPASVYLTRIARDNSYLSPG